MGIPIAAETVLLAKTLINGGITGLCNSAIWILNDTRLRYTIFLFPEIRIVGRQIKWIPKEGGNAPPSASQSKWLTCGLTQAGGKLPLFDEFGKRVSDRTVKVCVDKGWAEPWFNNPIKPDWMICKLTDNSRRLVSK